MTIGSRIAMLRKQKKLTQMELAQMIHVSPKTVSKWENDYGLPDLLTVPLLAEVLDVDADYLLAGRSKVPSAFMPDPPRKTLSVAEGKPDPNVYKLALYQVTHNQLSVWIMLFNVLTIVLALICGPIEVKMLEGDRFSPFTILTAIYPPWGNMGNSGVWEVVIGLLWLVMLVYLLITSFLFLRATLNGCNEYFLALSFIQFAGVTGLLILSFLGSSLANLHAGETILRLNVFYILLFFCTFFQFMLVYLVSRQGKVLRGFKSLTALVLAAMLALSASGLTIPQKVVASDLDYSSVTCSDVSYFLSKTENRYVDGIEILYVGETILDVRANRKVGAIVPELYMRLTDNILLYATSQTEYLKTVYKSGEYHNFFKIDYHFVAASDAEIENVSLYIQLSGIDSQKIYANTQSVFVYEEADMTMLSPMSNESSNSDYSEGIRLLTSYKVCRDLTVTGGRIYNAENAVLSLSVGKEDEYGIIRYEEFFSLMEGGGKHKIGPSSGNGKTGWFALAFSIKQAESLVPAVFFELQTTEGSLFLRCAINRNFVIEKYLDRKI